MSGPAASEVVTWVSAGPGTVVVTMDRPPANALAPDLLDGLHAAIEAAETGGAKVVVIASAREGFFAAGADIKHLGAIDGASFTAYGDLMREVNDRLAAAPFLSVAAIDGLALGGGLELAMACSLRVAGPGARLGLPEVLIGLIPGAGGTQRLPRLVGRGRALDIMLTGRQVGAAEAGQIGLVDRLTDGPALDAALEVAGALVGPSLPAQLAVVRTVDAAFDRPLAEGIAYEREQEQDLFDHGEAAEGISAFIEKRRPQFG